MNEPWGGFGMALQREVSALGIAVTNIYPSFADTRMLRTPSFGRAEVQPVRSFMIDNPGTVIRQALRGIARRKLHVVPGIHSRVGAFAAKLWPLVFSLPVKMRVD